MPTAPPQRGDERFAGEVNSMFDRISGVYDRMNHVMTAGLDRTWRSKAADRARLSNGERALDICCGTGDLAIELAARVGSQGSVVGCDFSRPMLEIAKEKGTGKAGAASLEQLRFEWADALDLPYEPDSFEAVTIAFGARNLADLNLGLAEMFRVLKPGGRLAVLEITQPTRRPLADFFNLWFDRLAPLMGRLAGDSSAYAYLPESVRSFPAAGELAARMDSVGFKRIGWTIMAGGIIALHTAEK